MHVGSIQAYLTENKHIRRLQGFPQPKTRNLPTLLNHPHRVKGCETSNIHTAHVLRLCQSHESWLRRMAARRDIICSLILLMLLLQLAVTCGTRGCRSGRLRGEFGFPTWRPVQHKNGSFGGNTQQRGDEVLEEEKRRVNTGPNPLHNR